MVFLVRLFLCTFFILLGSPTLQAEETPPVQIQLIHEETTVKPGQPFWVAIHVKIADHWHAYWKNPGETGMAPIINWTLPEGFKTPTTLWPTPERFEVNGIVGYGYQGEVVFLAQLEPPQTLPKQIEIKAQMNWLVCSDATCLPGESSLALSLPSGASSSPTSWQTLFAEARSDLPREQQKVEVSRDKGLIALAFTLPEKINRDSVDVYFFPEESHSIDHKVEPTLTPKSEKEYVVTLQGAEKAEKKEKLKGILLIDGETSQHAIAINSPIMDISSALQVNFWMVLAFAFLGGMILNLMPCVLPVISLKVLSFVKLAGKQRALIWKHGTAFAFGVLISFWALAGILLLFQAYGHAVGWGFQLQEPMFVGVLALFLFAFSLSLFGLFDIGTALLSLGNQKSRQENLYSSFFSGILATIVATPCTGPFLGSAVGYAVTASPQEAMLIFTFLGIGMAFPYLILALFPGLMKFLPKPGPWMQTFKEITGFVLLATVLWLIWVFNAQTNSFSLIMLLLSLFVVSIGCWIYGKWSTPIHSRLCRILSIGFAGACILLGGYVVYMATTPEILALEQTNSTDHPESWETFSPERVAELQKQGVPVLVDFTAKWCLICQMNHVVLSSQKLEEKYAELGAVKMKADWTKNDPVITEELRKHGRSGVPLYLLYGTEGGKPEVLPQVLTEEIVMEYLDNI